MRKGKDVMGKEARRAEHKAAMKRARPGPGRKPLPEDEKKSVIFRFSATDGEAIPLRYAAQRNNLDVHAYCKQAALTAALLFIAKEKEA